MSSCVGTQSVLRAFCSTQRSSVAKTKTLPQCTQPRGTGSHTNRRSESDTQLTATVEEVPKCKKCGRTFPWNQLQLFWKHKCEPTEAETPDLMYPL